jgi:hypothetical protein
MSHMLRMAALEVSDPMILLVGVKTDDASWHTHGEGRVAVMAVIR